MKRDPDESHCDLTMEPPPIKRCRISNGGTADAVWLKLEKVILNVFDKEALQNNLELNDRHINYCQGLLKKQFPLIGDFILTLLQNSTLKDKISFKSFIVNEGIIGLLLLGVSHVITQLEYMTLFLKQWMKNPSVLQ